MRALFGTVASGQMPPSVAFAFDAVDNAAGSSSGGRVDLSWTHTPVGIPKGVIVLLANENTVNDAAVSGVTYGGVAMSALSGSPFTATLGPSRNDCVLYGFVLTSGIPTGAQTVAVDNVDTGGALNGVSFTVTGPNNTAVEDTSTVDSSGADPTLALTINEESFVCGMCYSGHITTADIAAGSNMTHVLEVDTGSETLSFLYRTALVSTNSSVDWTALTQTYGIFAVAIKST